MNWLVLASGFGTRLCSLTFNKAKASLGYKSRQLLTYFVASILPIAACNSETTPESTGYNLDDAIAYLIETDEAYAYSFTEQWLDAATPLSHG
jgi:NDP-sugar pyrophosphorylase family protein